MLSSIEIGKRLKHLRLKKDITIEELSADTGISVSSLNKYEIGRRRPRDENKEVLARYYGMDEAMLFYSQNYHSA